MFDENFFVISASVTFILLAFKPVAKLLSAITRKYSQQVSNSITEAEKLRQEANTHLELIRKKSIDLHEEVHHISEQSKKEAQLILEESRLKAEKIIEHRTNLAAQRIAQEEANIQDTVRKELVAHVLSMVEYSLIHEMDKKTEQDMAEHSISELKKNMH